MNRKEIREMLDDLFLDEMNNAIDWYQKKYSYLMVYGALSRALEIAEIAFKFGLYSSRSISNITYTLGESSLIKAENWSKGEKR